MKRINAYLAIVVLFFSIQIPSVSAMQEQNQPTSSWFSYFAAPLVSFANSIKETFTAVKNYFFPVAIQQPEEQPAQPEKESLPKEIVVQEAPKIKPKIEVPSFIKQPAEEFTDLQLPLLGVSYNCAQKRLDLIFENIQPRYFHSIDSYQYSPQKKYILANKIENTLKIIKKTSTMLIDYSSNTKEIATFKSIKMYEFSPEETKLLFLTSDTSMLQQFALQTPLGTFGTAKPSTKHEEQTGILKKTSDIFTYHIFDLKAQKIINSFENATGVFFNNEDEVTVYFEDSKIEVHKLNTTLLTSLTRHISVPPTQQSQEFYQYSPHENKLVLPLTGTDVTFTDVDTFYFSPQKKYLLLEQNPMSAKASNLIKGINPNFPLVKLVNMQTGEAISNFGTPNMLMNDTTNIITYEFSPEERKILLQTRGQYGCRYILFDIEQNSIIDQPIASAQSVHFKNENEFIIIDAQGKTKDISINVVQETTAEKLFRQFTTTTKKEKFFENTLEEMMYNFKKNIKNNATNTPEKVSVIINEIASNKKKEEAQQQFLTDYRNWTTTTQKTFVNVLFEQYAQESNPIQQQFVSAIFCAPSGYLYDEKSQIRNEITNELNTVKAEIDDTETQELLKVNSIETNEVLLETPIAKSIRAMTFNPPGNFLAVSYQKEPEDTTAPLTIFLKEENNHYEAKDFSVKNSDEIIGLLFLDENMLLTLDNNYKISSIYLTEKQTEHFSKAVALLKNIEKLFKFMEKADVNSPEIFKDLSDKTDQLDNIVAYLPKKNRDFINKQQQLLKTRYEEHYTKIIKDHLLASWTRHKNTIMRVATYFIIPTISAATLPLLQAITTNVSLNTNALLIASFSAIASTAAAELNNRFLKNPIAPPIIGGTLTALTEQINMQQNQTISISFGTSSGILKGAFLSTVAAEVANIIKNEGGAPVLLQKYLREFVQRTSEPLAKNEFTNTALPIIQKYFNNKQISEPLAQIVYVAFESACIGMGMYCMGIGFSDEASVSDALYYNALRGIMQGSINYSITMGTQKTGALYTIPTAHVSSSLVNYMAKGTQLILSPSDAAASIIHATVEATTNLLVDKSGGFTELLKAAGEKLKKSTQERWSGTYNFFSKFTTYMLATEEESENDDVAYGSV
jgi:hypothetical protein